MVKKCSRKKHLISGDSLGTIVSNILSNGDCGLLDVYPEIKLFLNGNDKQKLPHLELNDEIIYLCGYSDVAKFKKVLGGQFGAVFIDECNIADMSFIRELFLPRFEYCCMTLNPDNPNKEIYNEIINRARPIEKYKDDVPKHIWNELNKSKEAQGWHYWYFTFEDNPSMTEERKQMLLNSLLPETREYQTKILGVRTVGTGLVLPLTKDNIITEEQAKTYQYQVLSCGIDTSYSSKSHDTFSMVFDGITKCGKLITLEEETYNNKDRNISLSPSDMALKVDEFFSKCCKKWGITKAMYIDNADAGTIREVQKYSRENARSYYPVGSWKKLDILSRINLQNGWIKSLNYLIVNTCKEKIREHNCYVWDGDKDKPQDGNDHTINADQYAWVPYKHLIGIDKREVQ